MSERPICQGPPFGECGRPAKWICVLATRSVARCENHSSDDQFISVVITRQPVNPKDAMKYVVTS